MEVEIGDLVLLRLKNKSNTRCIKGIIVDLILFDRNLPEDLTIRLEEDYIGKNETWFVGENKTIKRSQIKTICKL